LSGLGETRGLPPGRREISMTQSTAPALAQNKPLAVLGEVRRQLSLWFGARGRQWFGFLCLEIDLQPPAARNRPEQRTLTGTRAKTRHLCADLLLNLRRARLSAR